ncbi:MAG TPA: methionyl-tRNA formyltransferase [Nitrospira sp.]|nr:methionyl-tRNA formyltransferase [Nitrospira sp.]
MRIVFMGTPEFAVPSLEALLKSADPVVGIVTQPDRPRGRGLSLMPSPVKRVAQREGIPLLQPTKMKDPDFLRALADWKPDVIAVAAFGRILPPTVLSLPSKGCINVHGSLLPKYRGAGPVQWAIINGETETGITTMLMDEGMDTGAILLQEAMPIGQDDTAGSLSAKLAELGGRLLVRTLEALKAGTLVPRAQNHAQATLAPLLKKEDGLLDWTLPATSLVNRIRGLTPWPGAVSFYGDERWTILKGVASRDSSTEAPGTITAVTRQSICVQTGDGILAITELQPANGRRMRASDYLAGHQLDVGRRLASQPDPR